MLTDSPGPDARQPIDLRMPGILLFGRMEVRLPRSMVCQTIFLSGKVKYHFAWGLQK